MKFGSPNKFDNVPVLSDNGIITKSYLRNLENSIKQRTPIAGAGIKINVSDGGFNISTDNTGAGTITQKLIELTVCSNGIPAKIKVYGI